MGGIDNNRDSRPSKGMQISVGDEGGSGQSPHLAPPVMAQTTRAAQRPTFSFAVMADEEDEDD